MQEIEIELVHRRRRSHRPVRLVRYDASDARVVYNVEAQHIYNPYFGSDGHGWRWDGWGYVTLADRFGNQPEAWAYVVEFRDGTKGVCRVRDVNVALGELGARVDRRGDARD